MEMFFSLIVESDYFKFNFAYQVLIFKGKYLLTLFEYSLGS